LRSGAAPHELEVGPNHAGDRALGSAEADGSSAFVEAQRRSVRAIAEGLDVHHLDPHVVPSG